MPDGLIERLERAEGPSRDDVCRCGCLREEHSDNGPCAAGYCRPACGGFLLAMTGVEMGQLFDQAVAEMRSHEASNG